LSSASSQIARVAKLTLEMDTVTARPTNFNNLKKSAGPTECTATPARFDPSTSSAANEDLNEYALSRSAVLMNGTFPAHRAVHSIQTTPNHAV
jgi:hypothetical protein